MIRKVLIVRKAKMRSDLIAKSGLKPFIKGEALSVSPKAWNEEAGISHWGYVLELKLKDYEQLMKWNAGFPQAEFSTVLDLEDMKPESVEASLASVGLRIHPSAE